MKIVLLTHTGQLGTLQADAIPTQQRAGRGTQRFPLDQGDRLIATSAAEDDATVLIFTNYGRAFSLAMADLPAISQDQNPAALADLVSLKAEEVPTTLLTTSFAAGEHILFATSAGIIKKTSADAYDAISTKGVNAIRLDEGDTLAGTSLVTAEQDVFLGTASGLAIRFAQDDAKATARDTRGVRGIRLRDGDKVTSLLTATPDDAIATISLHGFGKRSMADEYRLTNRGGTGITSIKSSERNGPLVALVAANDDSNLLLASHTGRLLRIHADDIRPQSRNTAGVRLFRLAEDDTITSAIAL